ncbi:H-NS family nucleoid-associated regulatory protein [Paraburkholderia tropica]|uniref:H-NS family nucleoid-associated regulatory protein n=1 Tax=Paraburkholderia tropica TaxID=92647 RepID=UPI002AB163FC|nr:H-NS family nucleoid-associated regulatory protein [Paraburkholderia tropica]
MATLESIQAKIAKLKAQAEVLVTTKSTAVLERIRGLMDKHGIVVADIEAFVGKRRGRKPGVKSAAPVAKYRDPKSGATWTGHGRAPAWIANAKDRSKFLTAEGAVEVASPKLGPKAGAYRRGPQPALYRDPKSGATWSGRGRAPAWLAGARDRSKFLIADAGTTAVESKPAKKAAAKKAAPAKNAAATKAKKTAPAKKAAATKKAPAKKAAPTKKVAVKRTSRADSATANTETLAPATEATAAE